VAEKDRNRQKEGPRRAGYGKK